MTEDPLLRYSGASLRKAPAKLRKKIITLLDAWPSNRGQSTQDYSKALQQAVAQLIKTWDGQWLNAEKKDCLHLKLRCTEGHEWRMRVFHLHRGQWCPTCYLESLKLTIRDMQKLARPHRGHCVSTQYVNSNTKLTWRCQQGHLWDATPYNIKAGNWCPQCNQDSRQKQRLEEMKKLARERGGECLSDRYINSSTKLTWRCDKGHTWETTPIIISAAQSWCPVCRYDNMKRSLADMQALATERGGKCLTTEYTSMNHKMRWQCSQGHQWEAVASRVQLGSWCPQCVHQSLRSNIEEMQALAKSRRGKCLSTEYVNGQSKLEWQCQSGHTWLATPSHIKNGTWCPVCAKRFHVKHSLKTMQALARSHGGRCLSMEYVSVSTKMRWQCKLGHVWETRPGIIMYSKSWCPECQYLSQCTHEESRRKHLPIGKPETNEPANKSTIKRQRSRKSI